MSFLKYPKAQILFCWQNDCFDAQYHGGTNFGRSASGYITTGYYDQAPLDEYGSFFFFFFPVIYICPSHLNSSLSTDQLMDQSGPPRQPKYGHLKELHAAVKLCSKPLLSREQTTHSLGEQQEVRAFGVLSKTE